MRGKTCPREHSNFAAYCGHGQGHTLSYGPALARLANAKAQHNARTPASEASSRGLVKCFASASHTRRSVVFGLFWCHVAANCACGAMLDTPPSRVTCPPQARAACHRPYATFRHQFRCSSCGKRTPVCSSPTGVLCPSTNAGGSPADSGADNRCRDGCAGTWHSQSRDNRPSHAHRKL
jgi:hypothetical protein